jgi:hypothetical protein
MSKGKERRKKPNQLTSKWADPQGHHGLGQQPTHHAKAVPGQPSPGVAMLGACSRPLAATQAHLSLVGHINALGVSCRVHCLIH